MRVVTFRHVPFEGLGLIEAALQARGIEAQYADLYRDDVVAPDPAGAAGLIFLGGPMSVNDPLPYLGQEIDIIRGAIASGQPVLGICLGSQLIASALGARVYRNRVKEIGWYDIHFSEAGRQDLFQGIGSCATVFHWHSETFDLPPGAVQLAWSDACRNQAYRVGECVYGLQFHAEVTPEMIETWLGAPENCGDVRKLEQPINPSDHAAGQAELAQTVFGRWCDMLKSRNGS